MTDLFDTKYLLDPTPRIEYSTLYFMISVFLITIIAAYVYKAYLKKHKHDMALRKTMRQVPRQLFLTGLIGLLYAFSIWQRLPYLSMVFVGMLLLLTLDIIILRTLYKFRNVYPLELKHHLRTTESSRYLPKKKKK